MLGRKLAEEHPLLEFQPEDFDESRSYGLATALAMMINIIVGTGVFSLPYAFSRAGVGLGSSLILAFAALTTLSILYILEVMARTRGMMRVTNLIELSCMFFTTVWTVPLCGLASNSFS